MSLLQVYLAKLKLCKKEASTVTPNTYIHMYLRTSEATSDNTSIYIIIFCCCAFLWLKCGGVWCKSATFELSSLVDICKVTSRLPGQGQLEIDTKWVVCSLGCMIRELQLPSFKLHYGWISSVAFFFFSFLYTFSIPQRVPRL